jgi:peptidoglycan/LPS O-acetylase OafA/YrhL
MHNPPAGAPVPRPGERFAGLDGIRAVALLLVLLEHAAGTARFPFPSLLEWLPGTGFFGVQIFFVLSGFLQTSLLLADERRFGRVLVRRFYVKRILRIAPLCVMYLVVLGGCSAISRQQITALDVASVLLCFKHVVGGSPLLAHFWSLSIEILFYIAWPLVLARLPASRRSATALAAVVAMPLSGLALAWLRPDTEALHLSRLFRGEGILLGCWLAFRPIAPPEPRAAWRIVAAFGAGLAMLHLAPRATPAQAAVLGWLQIFPALVMVAAALRCRDGWLAAALNSRAARWLALISFGTYVWQQMFFFARPQELLVAWAPLPLLYQVVWFPGNVLGALAAGALSWHLLERPLHRWRERLAASLVA